MLSSRKIKNCQTKEGLDSFVVLENLLDREFDFGEGSRARSEDSYWLLVIGYTFEVTDSGYDSSFQEQDFPSQNFDCGILKTSWR